MLSTMTLALGQGAPQMRQMGGAQTAQTPVQGSSRDRCLVSRTGPQPCIWLMRRCMVSRRLVLERNQAIMERNSDRLYHAVLERQRELQEEANRRRLLRDWAATVARSVSLGRHRGSNYRNWFSRILRPRHPGCGWRLNRIAGRSFPGGTRLPAKWRRWSSAIGALIAPRGGWP